VSAGVWVEEDDAEGEEAWRIHDFLDYNKSRRQVENERRKRARAGRAGGRAKAAARNGQADA
jgi:hypothetical protein